MKCRRNVNDLAPLRDENGALVITAIFFGGVLIAFLEEKEKGINMNNNEKKENIFLGKMMNIEWCSVLE